MTPQKNEPKQLVTVAELCRLTGWTDPTVRGRIKNGHWVENKHYYRRGRKIMMDKNQIDAWWTDKNK